MPCQHVSLPGGGSAIVCGRTKRQHCACGTRATRLCDWKAQGNRSGTCDRPLCADCSHSPAPEKDLCPDHARDLVQWERDRRAVS